MKTVSKVAVSLLMLLFVSSCPHLGAQNSSSVDRFIASASLEEKVAMLVGARQGHFAEVRDEMPASAKSRTYSDFKPALSFVHINGGVCTGEKQETSMRTTAFPVPYLLAMSWNKDLLYKVGVAEGKEVRSCSADAAFLPALNVIRNPLAGNVGECLSEDPVLISKLSAALLKGLQSQGAGGYLKYFFMSPQETNKTNVDVLSDQRSMRELYMKPFETLIRESKPWGVLVGYPMVNGRYQVENPYFLNELMRKQWQYEGVLATEYCAGKDVVEQLKAGINLVLPGCQQQYDSVLSAVRSGRLDEQTINERLVSLLSAVWRAPLLQSPVNSKEHAELSRQAALESMVLLKNLNESLPLASQTKRIAFYGVSSYHFMQGPADGPFVVWATEYASLPVLFSKAGYIVDPNVANQYTNHLKSFLPEEKKAQTPPAPKAGASAAPKAGASAPVKPGASTPAAAERFYKEQAAIASCHLTAQPSEWNLSKTSIQQYVKNNHAAIITIGHAGQYGRDRSLKGGYLLTETEIELIRNVCAAYHVWGKRVIVLLNVDGPVEMSTWESYPDAILMCGLPGQGGPQAIFDLLTGQANPSGKLNTVWAKNYTDYPSSQFFPYEYQGERRLPKVGNDYPATGFPFVDQVDLSERMHIGYRYFDEHQEKVFYPFGYGLSYTAFFYDKMTVSRKADSILVSVRITNTGKFPGKEVVQLYVSQQRKGQSVEKPQKELKDFVKTRLLRPNESQIISLRIAESDLSYYSESSQNWVTDKGSYVLKVGASSRDIRIQYPVQLQ